MKTERKSWIQRSAATLVCSGMAVFLAGNPVLASTKISPVQFRSENGESLIRVIGDSTLSVSKEENATDKQVVFELKGAKLSPGAARKIDTSSFPGRVKLISPYQVKGSNDTVRVVVQMTEMAAVAMKESGNVLEIRIPQGAAPDNSAAPAAAPSVPDAAAATPPAAVPGASDPLSAAPPAATPPTGADQAASGQTPLSSGTNEKDSLGSFVDNRQTKVFSGTPITIQVKDAEVGDVLRLIGEASGFNIVIGEDVSGKITLSLVEVPWDQALDVVLHTKKLGAERNNNLLRIVTLSSLASEKQSEFQAKQAAEQAAPKVTKIFPISYAKTDDLITILGSMTSTLGSGGGGGGSSGGKGGPIQIDKRTNSLIVQETIENVEKMKKMIEILDVQTPQVLIEAKVVEATESFSRALEGALQMSHDPSKPGAVPALARFNSSTSVDAMGVGSDASGLLGKAPSGPGNTVFGLSPTLSIFGGLRLTALLALTENEGQTKTIQSPKIAVLNGEQGSLLSSIPVTVRSPGSATEGGGFKNESAKLQLSVKPQVINDGNIRLELDISASEPAETGTGDKGVAEKSIKTNVNVENGSTLVVGGIYKMAQDTQSHGVPILRNIPLIGWLFGGESSKTTRAELFIFITPKILNERESGIGG